MNKALINIKHSRIITFTSYMSIEALFLRKIQADMRGVKLPKKRNFKKQKKVTLTESNLLRENYEIKKKADISKYDENIRRDRLVPIST